MGASALIAAPAILRGAAPTADPVRVGHIGTGTRGWDLIKYTGASDSAKVVAVCDVYKPHLRRGVAAAAIRMSGRTWITETCWPTRKSKRSLLPHRITGTSRCSSTPPMQARPSIARRHGPCDRLGQADSRCDPKKQNHHATGPSGAAVCRFGRRRQDDPRRQARAGTFVKTGRYFNNPPDKPVWRWYGYYSWYDRPDPKQVVKELDWQKWLGSRRRSSLTNGTSGIGDVIGLMEPAKPGIC